MRSCSSTSDSGDEWTLRARTVAHNLDDRLSETRSCIVASMIEVLPLACKVKRTISQAMSSIACICHLGGLGLPDISCNRCLNSASCSRVISTPSSSINSASTSQHNVSLITSSTSSLSWRILSMSRTNVSGTTLGVGMRSCRKPLTNASTSRLGHDSAKGTRTRPSLCCLNHSLAPRQLYLFLRMRLKWYFRSKLILSSIKSALKWRIWWFATS